MSHHLLHVRRDERLPVLVDLAAAPGRTLVFARTKRGARTLTRQLVAAGVAASELHGNLGQNARTRSLAAFAEGGVRTLVATDIAARGIHVDDVALVVHADPPVEHKAYLHRSGRTARAGATGTVVTLMTDGQAPEVRELTRKAGIAATTTRLRPGHALLRELAPGEWTIVPRPVPAPVAPPAGRQRGVQPAQASRGRRGGTPSPTHGTATVPSAPPRSSSGRSGAAAFSARARPGRRRDGGLSRS